MAGVYVCSENHLHCFAEELCTGHGYEPTPENVLTLLRAARDLFREKWPDTPIVED
jgi:hypothetical protein